MDIFDAMAAGKVKPPPPPSRTADDGALTEAELACSQKGAPCRTWRAASRSAPTTARCWRAVGVMQALVRQALVDELAALGSRRK